ncbi:MAG: glycosyltransferase [Ferruginibacter sp.]|nr:glycosyltransferase [Ferruginibacter sp.]
MQPSISVILPVYNGGRYLHESIQSVLKQNYTYFEFLILDDCSTDDSWAYIREIKDEKVTIYRNENNKGLFFNLNFLIKKSKYDLIKLWSQDDIMYPGCLNAFGDCHRNYPDLGFSYSKYDTIDENGSISRNAVPDSTPMIISPQLHARIAFFTGSIAGNIANVCINRKAMCSVGWFNETMKISADFDMWVRLARDHKTAFIAEPLIQLRNHTGQLSRNETLFINHLKEDREVYRYLLSYVGPELRKEGIRLMRNFKLVFYYTLMIKAFLHLKFKTGFAFYSELSAFDNFLVVTFCFIKAKIRKPVHPKFS